VVVIGRFRALAVMLIGFFAFGVTPVAYASASLTFKGLVRTINTGGSILLSSPAAIVVDSKGNVYLLDTNNSRVVEVNAQGAPSVLTISGLSPASLSSPSGIAIDGAGDLYIADTGNSRIVKVTPSGTGSTIGTGSVNLSFPQGIALDQSGDIFIADTGHNHVVEVTSEGESIALAINVSSGAASLNSPRGLATDITGRLYIADSSNNRVVTVAVGSASGMVLSTGELSPALSNPTGVAVDRVGNILIADTGHNRIAEVDTSGVGTILSNFLFADSLVLSAPLGVAVDAFGAVYIADTGNNRALIVDPGTDGDPESGAGYTSSLNKTAVGFGHVSLGSSTSSSLILTFSVGSPVSGLGKVNVFTSGAQGLDFQIVKGENTTCNSASESGSSCTVEVSFLPTAPGLRRGALVLYDPDSNPILTAPLYGFGDAPVAALSSNVGSVISAGSLPLSNPFQLALDGAGNMYVGDYSGSNVTKISAGGGNAAVVNLGIPGSTVVSYITGVALDGAGNLFIGDHENSRILVVTPGGVVSVLNIIGLSPSLGFPTALVFDAAGALYIADFTNGRIVEVSSIKVAESTSTGIGTVIYTGSYSFAASTLTGLTIDPGGTIYAAARAQNDNSIIKVTASGVASPVAIPTNIVPTISYPQGVAADGMGNVYIADSDNDRIVKITTAGVASVLSLSGLPIPSTLGSSVYGVTVDPSGNLYIPDWTNNRIVFANVSASALTFASATADGSTDTSDGALSVTITNDGDEPLTAVSPGLRVATNFTQVEGSETPADCTAAFSLAEGKSCNLSLELTPVAPASGTVNGAVVLTDNNLNTVPSATQTINLMGSAMNGPTATQTIASVTLTQSHAATPFTPVTGSGGTVPLTYSVSPALPAGLIISASTGAISGIPMVATPGMAYTVTIIDSASETATATFRLTVDGAVTATTSIASTALTFYQATASFTPVTSAGGDSPLSYTVAPTLPAGLTFSATTGAIVGTPTVVSVATNYTVTVTDANNATVTAMTSIAVNEQASQTTVTASASSTASVQTVTLTATVIATNTGTPVTPTGTVTFFDDGTALMSAPVTAGVAQLTTLLPAGATAVVTAVYSGDGNFLTSTSSDSATVVVGPSELDFTFTNSGTAAYTAAPGAVARYNFDLAPLHGSYPGIVSFSVTGLPTGATANFTPGTVAADVGATPVVMTVQTAMATAQDHRHDSFFGRSIVLALLFLPFAAKRRARERLKGRILLLLIGLAAPLAGCGSQNGFFLQSKSPTYTLTVTAASGTLHESQTVTLIVQ